jgi:uncharacterized membrane protein required for colicin V production
MPTGGVHFQAINVPDVALGILLMVGIFLGLAIGLYRQVIVLATAYVATLIASRLYTAVGPTIPLSVSPNGTVRAAIALGGLFVLLVIFLSWLTHYIPNPIGMTNRVAFLGGRAVAGALGFAWAFLLSAVLVTALVLSLGGNWGTDNQQTQLQVKYAIRQSTVVQMLRTVVEPVSTTSKDLGHAPPTRRQAASKPIGYPARARRFRWVCWVTNVRDPFLTLAPLGV